MTKSSLIRQWGGDWFFSIDKGCFVFSCTNEKFCRLNVKIFPWDYNQLNL